MCAIFGPTKNFGKISFKSLSKKLFSNCSKKNKHNNSNNNKDQINKKKIPFKTDDETLAAAASTITQSTNVINQTVSI